MRFVRFHAAGYKIEPNHIGITGTCSGRHLSLRVATAPDAMKLTSKDPIDNPSTRVKAAAVCCAPTNFVHYGKIGESSRNQKQLLKDLRVDGAFRYREFIARDHDYFLVEEDRSPMMDFRFSPARNVTSEDRPICICHCNEDEVVSFQQVEAMQTKPKTEKKSRNCRQRRRQGPRLEKQECR